MAAFHYYEDYVLENERTRLEPLRYGHLNPLRVPADNPEIWKYFLEDGYGANNFERYINRALDQHQQRVEYPFVIIDKATDTVAGCTRLYDIDPQLGIIKVGHTWIGKDFQGTGLNKHAKYLLFEFLFETLGFERVGFGASSENLRSIAALEKVGAQHEGRLRSYLPNQAGDGRADIVLMSMLRTEWLDTSKARLRDYL